MKPQTCKKCGRIQNVIWIVDDELWKKVCKEHNLDIEQTLCIECFAELAGFILLENITENVKLKKLW